MATTDTGLPSLLITGLIKNGEPWIETVLRNVLRFCNVGVETKVLDSCQLLVYENGSTDGTRETLRRLVSHLPGLTVLLGENPPPSKRERTNKMAHARNALLEYVLLQEKNGSHAVSHMAVVDLDGAFNMEPVSELLQAFQYTSRWDVLSFDATIYYDYWALRCADKGEKIVAHQNCNYPPDGGNHTCKKCFFDECLFSKLSFTTVNNKTANPFDHLVPVQSAFNGLVFYRLDSIGPCRYSHRNRLVGAKRLMGRSHQDCEHVAFHLCIGDGTRENRRLRVVVAPVKQVVNKTQGGVDLEHHISYTTRQDDRCRAEKV